MLKSVSGIFLDWSWKPKAHDGEVARRAAIIKRLCGKPKPGKMLESQFVMLGNGEADYKTLYVCNKNVLFAFDGAGALYRKVFDNNSVFKYWEKVEEFSGVKF